MANLLYLVHRLPYPPNKGDKVRSYHLLRHLAQSHDIFLGTFIDDKEDWLYVSKIKSLCADLHVVSLNPLLAKLRSLMGLLTGAPLTLPYYQKRELRSWVEEVMARYEIDAIVVFSSAMAQYVPWQDGRTVLVDFVDLDSAKWDQYAPAHRWPMSWIYRREGRRLLGFECEVAERADCSFFVTENETELFRKSVPDCRANVETIMNGVDADFFNPEVESASPFVSGTKNIVFTGAMDYWPNVDAVAWFAKEVFPVLRAEWSSLNFYIVGRSPAATVEGLAGNGVIVTGTVPDVRPYLKHADVVVAPMRLARGIQNKILEAMAMACPVVAAKSCVDAIGAKPGVEICEAEDAEAYVDFVGRLLRDREHSEALAQAGRGFILSRYGWDVHLSKLDAYLARL